MLPERDKTTFRLSDGSILTIVAAFGPACAYLFELGYGTRFDVPTGLIALDATDAAGMTILLFMLLGSYLAVLEGIVVVIPRFRSVAQRLLWATPSAFVLAASIWHVIARAADGTFDTVAVLLVLLMLLTVVYAATIERSVEPTLVFPLVGPKRLTTLTAVGSSVLLLYVAYRSGFLVAETQQTFQTTEHGRVVLRIYGDKRVTVAVVGKQVQRPVQVENAEGQYMPVKLGPLLPPK